MKNIGDMDKNHVALIVDGAINSIYKQIQDEIGVTSGDWASIYHSGEGDKLQEEMTQFFIKYIAYEKSMAK